MFLNHPFLYFSHYPKTSYYYGSMKIQLPSQKDMMRKNGFLRKNILVHYPHQFPGFRVFVGNFNLLTFR